MTRKIKARDLGDEHVGARIRTTASGWTIEGELAGFRESSGYHLDLRAGDSLRAAMVRKDADVAILEEAQIRHPDEPTGLGAVVEADTGDESPVRWVCAEASLGSFKWLRPEPGFGVWCTWVDIQEEAISPIRVLSEGVHPSDDEPETPEVYAGMVITEWPENDEHLLGWWIEDCDGDEWRWEPKEWDQIGEHWRWDYDGFSKPGYYPWKVLKKVSA